MPSTDEWTEQGKQAMSLLNVQIQTHERYHTQKENITWVITAAYLGATVLLVGHQPFWEAWSPIAFALWLTLLFGTAAAVLLFLHSQFQARHRASAFFVAALDVATTWISKPPEQNEFEPKTLHELDDMLVPAAVEARFSKVRNAKSSLPQRVAFSLAVVWSVAAAAYVICTYAGCQCP